MGGSLLFVTWALVSGRVTPLAIAIGLLGAIYVIPGMDGALPAPVYAGALLLMAELAWWSIDERVPAHVERGTRARRLAALLAVVACGTAAATLVQLAANADTARSPTATAIAVGAVLACLAVVAVLGRARGLGRSA
jgi:hypothetical protein